MFITAVNLKASTQTALRDIIRDPAAADKFIQAAQDAISVWRIRQGLPKPLSSPQRLQRLRGSAQRYRNVLESLTQQDVTDLRFACMRTDLDEVIQTARQSANDVCALLATSTPIAPGPRGRLYDGNGIMLIQALAHAFNDVRLYVGTGERSKFVRVVQKLSDDEGLFSDDGLFSDARQKVRAALGGNKPKKSAI